MFVKVLEDAGNQYRIEQGGYRLTRVWLSDVTVERLASEGIYDIFHSDISGSPGGIRTSAKSTDRSIERTQTHIERGKYVRKRRSVRVVELRKPRCT